MFQLHHLCANNIKLKGNRWVRLLIILWNCHSYNTKSYKLLVRNICLLSLYVPGYNLVSLMPCWLQTELFRNFLRAMLSHILQDTHVSVALGYAKLCSGTNHQDTCLYVVWKCCDWSLSTCLHDMHTSCYLRRQKLRSLKFLPIELVIKMRQQEEEFGFWTPMISATL